MSAQFSFDNSNIKVVGKGLLFAAVGSALAYLSANLGNLNFGQYGVILMPIFTALIHLGEQYFTAQ